MYTLTRPHDPPGKGELLLTAHEVQISRVWPVWILFFFFISPCDGFSCHTLSFPTSCSSDTAINKYGFMVLSLPVAGFYDFFLFIFFLRVKINSCAAGRADELHSIGIFMP